MGGGGLLPTATDQELRREYALPPPIPGPRTTATTLGRLQA
eukprot:COSAG02_NODE_24282_length_693_cov_0.602694_1_plen_40_part_01